MPSSPSRRHRALCLPPTPASPDCGLLPACLSSSTWWLRALETTVSISTSLLEIPVSFLSLCIFVHIDSFFFFFNLLGILIRAHRSLTSMGTSSSHLRGWHLSCAFPWGEETNVHWPRIWDTSDRVNGESKQRSNGSIALTYRA